ISLKPNTDKKQSGEYRGIPQTRFRVFDTSEERQMAGPLTETQRAWHKKRLERKDIVTQRIFTRGFDMRTLAWEIDRKLVVMDSGYARQRENRQLLQESREDVARLVTRNEIAFSKGVMSSTKGADGRSSTVHPSDPMDTREDNLDVGGS
ncbi:hypothetical protein EGW08_021139, partial [Elysia chlorotica]